MNDANPDPNAPAAPAPKVAGITFVENWKQLVKRSYTMWLSYFFVVLSMGVATAALVSDWAQKLLGPFAFAASFFVAGCVLGFARLKKQPGSEGIV